ncbi:hypothetical protein LTS16_026556 [Friedmanniomyces endolithicus]|nr:hypothetical protein LTS16_026556 [Friedmanniomyces endolithicus]
MTALMRQLVKLYAPLARNGLFPAAQSLVLAAVYDGQYALPDQIGLLARLLRRLQLRSQVLRYPVLPEGADRRIGETSIVIQGVQGSAPDVHVNSRLIRLSGLAQPSSAPVAVTETGSARQEDEDGEDDGDDDGDDDDEESVDADSSDRRQGVEAGGGTGEGQSRTSLPDVETALINAYVAAQLTEQQARSQSSRRITQTMRLYSCTRRAAIAALYRLLQQQRRVAPQIQRAAQQQHQVYQRPAR